MVRVFDRRRSPSRTDAVVLWCAVVCAGLGCGRPALATQYPTRLFDSGDGLPIDAAAALMIDRDGYVWTCSGGYVARFDGAEFDAYGPAAGLNGNPQALAQTPDGTVWIATTAGLQYVAESGEPAIRTFAADSPPAHEAIADLCTLPSGALVVPSASGVFEAGGSPASPAVRLLQLARANAALTVDCDRTGTIWVSQRGGIVTRITPSGETASFPLFAGNTGGDPRGVHRDRYGHLWVATRDGLCLADADAPAGTPLCRRRFRELAGRPVHLAARMIETADGAIVVAAGSGLIRLDPPATLGAPFPAQWIGEAQGLRALELGVVRAAHDQSLWVADIRQGLWHVALGGVRSTVVPAPLLVRVSTPLREIPLERRGQALLDGLALGPQERALDVYVRAIGVDPDRRVLFRTLLEGVDRDWSRAGAQRLLRIAGLSAGRYVLRIRTEDETGTAGAHEARVVFTVRAPFFEQPWFIAALVGSVALVALAWQRRRGHRRLAIERTRTAIATDLHDEVGSGLSKIAVLSEKLARERPAADDPPGGDARVQIAEIARQLVDRMSDLVWAINPERDRVFSLAQRMRQFATPFLRARGIALDLHAIGEAEDRALDGDTRRELLLAFQELVNNAVKHSGCTRVRVELALRGAAVVLTVEDDGRGFDASAHSEGTGLSSIRRRAERLGGSCRIDAGEGRGATVEISAPVKPRR